MQAVCTELERNFTRCNEDLDAIAKKLDEDFESSNAYKRVRELPRPGWETQSDRTRVAGSVCLELPCFSTRCFLRCHCIGRVLPLSLSSMPPLPLAFSQNPLQLLQRVKALQDDLPKVQEEWQRVMVAKQTIIDLARQHQMANRRTLKQLHVAVEVEGDENEAPFERFRGIHEEWEQENRSRVESMQTELFGQTLLAPEELNMEVPTRPSPRIQNFPLACCIHHLNILISAGPLGR